MGHLIHSDNWLFPDTRQVAGQPRFFEVRWPFSIRTGDVCTIALPSFIYDCTSNIRLLWWFDAPGVGRGTVANLAHDCWYAAQYRTRWQADTVAFYDVMRAYGVGRAKARIKQAVVLGPLGWNAWRKKTPRGIANARRLVKFVPIIDTHRIELMLTRGALMAKLLRKADHITDPAQADSVRSEIMQIADGRMDDVMGLHDA